MTSILTRVSSVAGWVTLRMAAVVGPPPSLFPLPTSSRTKAVPSGRGFTLVELLTVIAILAVLCTLLLTALGSAQKKSRQARCAANLHQISLALNMYLDDFDRRAPQLQPLAKARYLPNREVLICPEDRTRNWGGLVNFGSPGFASASFADTSRTASTEAAAEVDEPLRFSYLHPLPWDDGAWSRLLKAGSLAGVAACQLHGLGRPNLEAPSIYDFAGLVLRAQRDGAVVQRKVFWERLAGQATAGNGPVVVLPLGEADTALTDAIYPWPLFVDEPIP